MGVKRSLFTWADMSADGTQNGHINRVAVSYHCETFFEQVRTQYSAKKPQA